MNVAQFLDQPAIGFFVGGSFSPCRHALTEDLISPYTKGKWKSYIPANEQDVKHAITTAKKAFPVWKNTPAPERGRILRKIGDLLLENSSTFANLMAHEMGKPITQGKGEVSYTAGYFHWFASEAERIYGMTIPSQFPDKELMIQYEPVGICAAITPWNFPIAMAGRKIAAALAAGCTIINKPSSESPISMLLFAYLCQAANLPEGVVNIIPGPEEILGKILLASSDVRKLSFTGSTETGKYLYRESADTLKKLTMELGGHAPLLVFDDANIDIAVAGTIASKFRNNGQTCVCPNRIFVQKSIYNAFLDKFAEETAKLKVGDPLDPQSDLSPILHPTAESKVKKHIADAQEKGAEIILQGSFPYEPCILSQVTSDMLIYKEETFGPVAAVIPFSTEREGVEMANDTPFGLASYFFSQDLSRCKRVASALQYGIVGVNDPLPSTYQASFGGIKSSGFGREGGPTAIKEYLVEKYISTSINAGN